MPDYGGYTASQLGMASWVFTVLMLVLVVWSLAWKGLALWHAARRGEKAWYVVLLILNTVGMLEIVYLFAIAKIGRRSAAE